jgi:protein gp37
MSDDSKIEWTDATWNPVTGCTEVSPGCDHCYAKTFAERFRGTPGHHFEQGFDVVLRPERLDQPLRWKKPRRIFVNSMSDLFHDSIPDQFIVQVFGTMALAGQHTFQLLTKRHGRMRSLLRSPDFAHAVGVYIGERLGTIHSWPLPNVWLGVSVENQQWANIRIQALLGTPAAVRFLSCEPLLGPVDLAAAVRRWERGGIASVEPAGYLDWVIAGGESGRGARPMDPDWVRSLRDQCTTAGVPFFYKQQGSGDGGPKSRRDLDGRTWDEYPQAVPA